MDPNLRRHQLVQQGAEEGTEGGMFALVDREFPIKAINIGDNLVLFHGRWHKNKKAPQPRCADIALANGSCRDGFQPRLRFIPIEIVIEEEWTKPRSIRSQPNQVGREDKISLEIIDRGSPHQFQAVGTIE